MSFKAIYYCHSEEETVKLAQSLAKISKVGDIWALFGTLGAGKSVFSRAFIQTLSGANEVPSPTFTLLQTYDAGNFEIYHYDLYRIKSPEEIWELNIEEAMYGGVCLIEWPEKMGGYLPRNILRTTIEVLADNTRQITIQTEDKNKKERILKSERLPDEQSEC